MKVLDVGTGNCFWMLWDAGNNPQNEYVGIDLEEDHYRIDSPQKIYRWFCGQMFFRAELRSDIDPDNTEVIEAMNYLGQEFEYDSDIYDDSAIEKLEKHDIGKTILSENVGDLVGKEESLFKIIVEASPEILGKTLRELFSYKPTSAFDELGKVFERVSYQTADFNNMPFNDASFDRIRAMGLVGNYESDGALAEAQRVLKNGIVVRVPGGIDTVYEDVLG